MRMLDLNFVRENLALVEEKLRQRELNPAEVLKDFGAIDTERRQAITQNETLQARRNRASEEIAKLKKSNQDASALIQETKELREQIQTSEKKAAEAGARAGQFHARSPHSRSRIHRGPNPVPGEFRFHVRHRPVAEVRARFVSSASR